MAVPVTTQGHRHPTRRSVPVRHPYQRPHRVHPPAGWCCAPPQGASGAFLSCRRAYMDRSGPHNTSLWQPVRCVLCVCVSEQSTRNGMLPPSFEWSSLCMTGSSPCVRVYVCVSPTEPVCAGVRACVCVCVLLDGPGWMCCNPWYCDAPCVRNVASHVLGLQHIGLHTHTHTHTRTHTHMNTQRH